MTDRIAPALTPRQWELRQSEGYLGEQALEGAQFLLLGGSELAFVNDSDARYSPLLPRIAADELPALIALANAALPDTDPRKITRGWIFVIRKAADHYQSIESMRKTLHAPEIAKQDADALRRFIDALESYLPPE